MNPRNAVAVIAGMLVFALCAGGGVGEVLAQKKKKKSGDEEMSFDADDMSGSSKKKGKKDKKRRGKRGKEEEPAEPAPPPEGEAEPEMTIEPDEVPKEGASGESGEEPAPQPEPGGAEPEPDMPEPTMPDEGVQGVEPLKADAALGDDRASWQDIVVVVRKPFLKQHRLELLPQFGITMNDNLIRHLQYNLAVNYYLTDILAVGVEGHLYTEQLREPFDLVGLQARRLPTVNKYNWGASLNFHYVPVYGKFAILDRYLIHWETAFTAGVGLTESEVLPRDPQLAPFTNLLITPNVGASMRFFVTRFLTVNIGVRDYVFVDRFEPANRSPTMFPDPESAKANADSSLINNVVFQAGIAFWFPPSFEYTTFR